MRPLPLLWEVEEWPRAMSSSEDQATKADLVGLEGSLRAEMGDLRADLAELRADVRALPTMRWLLALFVPVWLGVWGTVIAVVLKG